ncbi:hypothetical protein IWZ00DRAFT_514525, partial [Phyllosticta capitalensis]
MHTRKPACMVEWGGRRTESLRRTCPRPDPSSREKGTKKQFSFLERRPHAPPRPTRHATAVSIKPGAEAMTDRWVEFGGEMGQQRAANATDVGQTLSCLLFVAVSSVCARARCFARSMWAGTASGARMRCPSRRSWLFAASETRGACPSAFAPTSRKTVSHPRPRNQIDGNDGRRVPADGFLMTRTFTKAMTMCWSDLETNAASAQDGMHDCSLAER